MDRPSHSPRNGAESFDAPGGPRWHPRRWGVGTRLIGLVLIALIGLVTLGGTVTAARVGDVKRARSIQDDTLILSRLIAVRTWIHAERVDTEASLRAFSLGLTNEQAHSLLGFDPRAELLTDAQHTDEALDLLAQPDLVDRNELADIRREVLAQTIAPEAAAARFEPIDRRVRSQVSDMLARISHASLGGDGAGEIVDALTAAQAMTTMIEQVDKGIAGVENLFLIHADPIQTRNDLVTSETRRRVAIEQLDAVQSPTIAAAWPAIRDSQDARNFGDTIATTTNASLEQPATDLVVVANTARWGLAIEHALTSLISTAMAAVHDRAASLQAEAEDDLWGWIAFATAIIVVTISISLRFTRSISRPLRRLGMQAEAVRAGNLDVAPLAEDGPIDVTATMDAFDDLVANLRLLEAKAQALATCEFDAPVLTESLPGKLGESLQQSVRVLSGSIVERDELQRHLAHQATHDALTGLLNRAAAATALEQALRRQQRTGATVGVLFIDLDDFKQANDTYGHAVGDQVLQIVADRIASTIRSSDVLARLGGDEFMVLMEAVGDPADATELAHRIIGTVARTATIDDVSIAVGASIGIAFARDSNHDPDQLLAWADLAVYRAKHLGRNQIAIYDDSLQQELLERAEISEALAAAIAGDQLQLHYQPVLDATGELTGVEALVRWDRPGHGPLPPDRFIPVAEASSLIIDLDRWVLERAARQTIAWNDIEALRDIDVSVNISGRHLLSGDLPDHVADVLARTGLDPHRLVIEMTETVLVSDLPTAGEQLAAIRALGVRVAIDDFGTGYTSVTHLQRLPVDVLKIDRSFVSQGDVERNASLLAMMIDLGHHLGLTITAEGVETHDQLRRLHRLACDHAQGYLLSRPLPPHQLVEWVAQHDPFEIDRSPAG